MPTDPRQSRPAPAWQTLLGGAGRGSPVPPEQIRVSDAERHSMADALGKHYAEGRLDQSELEERVNQAMSAKTRGDLRGLLDDLPPLTPGGGQAPPPPPAVRPPRTHRMLLLVTVAIVAAMVGGALAAPWNFAWHVPWLLILIVGFFVLRGPLRYRHHHHYRDQRMQGWGNSDYV